MRRGAAAKRRDRRLRQSKVHQFGAALGKHDVARLQIAMEHAAAMSFLQPFANLGSNAEHLVERQAAFVQAFSEGFALQILHDDVVGAVLLAHIVEMADVGMAERGDGSCFAVKSLPGFGTPGKMRGQNLDRDGAVEPRIARAIHLAHAACAERLDDFVRTEFGPRREPHALRVIIAPLGRRHSNGAAGAAPFGTRFEHHAITPGWSANRNQCLDRSFVREADLP